MWCSKSPITGNRTYDIASAQQWPTKKESELRKEMSNDEALGDSLRLLYVALTRAQHQTLLWWSSTSGSDGTGLAHVLFGRTNGVIDPDLFSARRVVLPADADLAADPRRHLRCGRRRHCGGRARDRLRNR